MNEFDAKLKAGARAEETPLPEGFEKRMKQMLEGLPMKKKAFRLGKNLLIAAVVCAVLAASALAASPELREQIAARLGGFAPYVQEVEGVSCVEDGIEVKVVSAMADTAVVKVYAEARDLAGDRLSADISVMGLVMRDRAADGVSGSVASAKCVSYDETAKTALLEVTTWGMGTELAGAELLILKLGNADATWSLPLTIELVENRSFQVSGQVGGVELQSLVLSPLGLALETEGDAYPSSDVAIYFKNGDTLRMEGKFWGGGVSAAGRTVHWDFDDPIAIDTVVGASIGGWYIPLNADGTVEAGYWLDP